MINQDSGKNRPCSRVKPKVKYTLFQRQRVIFIPCSQRQRGKKHTLLSGTYSCSPYMGVTPPPPGGEAYPLRARKANGSFTRNPRSWRGNEGHASYVRRILCNAIFFPHVFLVHSCFLPAATV